MPVRSLNSCVLKWPDADLVHRSALEWARDLCRNRPDILRVGYIGSYARGDWGVGSDVDLVLVLRGSDLPFMGRATQFDATNLPVPADLLVYTLAEWEKLIADSTRFARVLRNETVWLVNNC